MPAGDYKFLTTLAIPANTHLHLLKGVRLSCGVTGGASGITLADGARLTGEGVGPLGAGSELIVLDTANISALVTNANQAIQEYLFIEGLYMQVFGSPTVTSMVDFVSVYANSGMCDVVINGSDVATNALRVRTGASNGAGQLSFDRCWFTATAGDTVKIESGAGGGGAEAWFNRCLFENCASGFACLGIRAATAPWTLVCARDCHFENNKTTAATTYMILVDGCTGFLLDQAAFYSQSVANKKGIRVNTAGSENNRVQIKNVTNVNGINPVLDDVYGGQTLAAVNVEQYNGGTGANGPTNPWFINTVRAPNGIVPKVKAGAPADSDFNATPPDGTLAVDTTNSKIYVRIGGAWKSVAVA